MSAAVAKLSRPLPPRAPGARPPEISADLLDRMAATVPRFGAALGAHRRGELSKARVGYLDLVDQTGMAAVCLHQLGVIAGQQGDYRRGADLIRRAIALDPDQPLFHQNLAISFEHLGNQAAALDALVDLGCALQKRGEQDQAIAIYRRILATDPCRYAAQVNMGTGLAWLGNVRGALVPLLRGVALHAAALPVLNGLLDTVVPRLIEDGLVPSDIRCIPGPPTGRLALIEEVLATLGKALNELGYGYAAIGCYQLAVRIAPGLALAHWNLSLALLTEGDYVRGWAEYEWRWHWDKFPEPRRILPAPEWRGESLAGKTIFVYSEQGYGDAIQFAPLVRRLAVEATHVTFEVTTPLVRLFRDSFAGDDKIAIVERPAEPRRAALPRALDYVVPLMSLPHRLGVTVPGLPLTRPYVRVAETDAWAERMTSSAGRKIGLVWAGRPTHTDDRKRSVPLAKLQRLFSVADCAWYSLQLGPARDQLAAVPHPIVDLSPHLTDFAETAAAIARLDVVVAVDTAVAHLAAAMGKPVCILLPAVADWRWLRNRADTPWYPGVRLFRQPAIGDWDSAIAALRRFLAEGATRSRSDSDASRLSSG